MTAQVMPQIINASEVSEAEAKRELRTSLTLAISEFHGESVRPSLVKNNRKECKMSPATTTTNMTTPTKEYILTYNGVDLEALQALVAALSFSPIRDGSSLTTTSSSSSNKQTFLFDSPEKQSNNSNLTTPWVKRGQAATPPTATLQQDDDEEEKEGDEQAVLTKFNTMNNDNDKENRPSIMEQKQQQETANTHNKNDHPVRKFRVPSPAEAVALAYPLSLPKEIMQPKTDNNNTTASLSQKHRTIIHSTTTNNNNNNNHNSSKPVKRYPTVSTDIPGAGTLRSSMSYRKSTPKLPFVPIVTHNANGTLARRGHNNHANNVAQHVYHHAKGVWAWGKGIMVVSPLMGMAEGVVSVAAGISTGNSNLQDVEQNVVSPFVVALDDHILNPVLGTVAGILSGILGGGGARTEQ